MAAISTGIMVASSTMVSMIMEGMAAHPPSL